MQISNLITILVAALVFSCETLLLLNLSNLNFFLVAHFLIILFLIIYLSLINYFKGPLLAPLLLLILTIGAGPFGAGTFILTALLQSVFGLFATPEKIWIEGLFPQSDIKPFEEIIQRIRSRWDDYSHLNEASSFTNLFTFGSLLDKQKVLDVIATDFDPQYAPLLRAALKDSQNAVRIQAAAITTKIDYDFSNAVKKLEKKHEESPHDLTTLLHLAELLQAYALAGILDHFRQKEINALALHYYRVYFQTVPEKNKNIWLTIARLLFYQKEYVEFIAWYHQGKEIFGPLPTIVDSWYLESLQKLGHYDEFFAHLKRSHAQGI